MTALTSNASTNRKRLSQIQLPLFRLTTALFTMLLGIHHPHAEVYDSVKTPPQMNSFVEGEDYKLRILAENLNHPWSIAQLPNQNYIISLRSGSLHLLSQSGELSKAISNVPDSLVKSQGGYFDLLIDKDFADTRSPNHQTIYFSFAHGSRVNNATRVVRAVLDANNLLLTNVTPIMTTSPFKDTAVHYGGRLAQLSDGSLLLSTGDGFQYREAAQDPFSQLGKILRFNTDGSVPTDNPFADGKNADPFVYSLGHRNPQGLIVTANDNIYMNEHGARGGDEINQIKAGNNYGWPKTTHGVNYSGALVTPYKQLPGIAPPLLHWTPSIAPSGLTLYQRDELTALKNCLLTGGLKTRDVRCARLEDNIVTAEYRLLSEMTARIRDIRVTSSGSILLLTDSDQGSVIEVIPAE